MLVYMLLNEVEERCYVGQTTKTLEAWLSEHWDSVRAGSQTRLHTAMRQWNDQCFWTYVVLQYCYEPAQLDASETLWIRSCDLLDPAIGYNERGGSPEKQRRAQPRMSEERREFFRECGRKGAAKSKAIVVARSKTS
jgi:hypothetical protein